LRSAAFTTVIWPVLLIFTVITPLASSTAMISRSGSAAMAAMAASTLPLLPPQATRTVTLIRPMAAANSRGHAR
jgi:hypothetical protein